MKKNSSAVFPLLMSLMINVFFWSIFGFIFAFEKAPDPKEKKIRINFSRQIGAEKSVDIKEKPSTNGMSVASTEDKTSDSRHNKNTPEKSPEKTPVNTGILQNSPAKSEKPKFNEVMPTKALHENASDNHETRTVLTRIEEKPIITNSRTSSLQTAKKEKTTVTNSSSSSFPSSHNIKEGRNGPSNPINTPAETQAGSETKRVNSNGSNDNNSDKVKTGKSGASEAKPAGESSRFVKTKEEPEKSIKTKKIIPAKPEAPETPEKKPVHVQKKRLISSTEFRSTVLSNIARVKYYPSTARQERIEGSVSVSFTVLPGGGASGIEIVQSSGSPLLDRAAIEAVQSGAPYLPLPSEKPDGLRIRIKINYYLETGR